MPLPDCITIEPLSQPVAARITVPGSKSISNRAMILGALAEGTVTIRGALWSEDTQVMLQALRTLGFEVEAEPDSQEPCNRTIRIRGQAGRIPRAGSRSEPISLYVANAGTAARFLAALVALGEGWYFLHGTERMHQRPQSGLFAALRQLGCEIEAEDDRLPARIRGIGHRPGRCVVDPSESSQFASALLMAAVQAPWEVQLKDPAAAKSGYIYLTQQMIQSFPLQGGTFSVEPDASSGSYFWAADWIQQLRFPQSSKRIEVVHWPRSGWQIDERFPQYLPPRGVISRERDLGDSILTAMVLAPLGSEPVRFTDLHRLRLQECERVQAMRTELSRCGAHVVEEGDELQILPGPLHGAKIETYNDHRIAMCFSILGLHIAGIQIQNPSCVRKTFPNFYQKLAAPPPQGLGVRILDSRTGRVLTEEDWMAELEEGES